MEAGKQSRIAEAKAAIARQREAHRGATTRLDQRRTELARLELALRNSSDEAEIGALILRRQTLAALIGSDSREAAKAEAATERAHENLKDVETERDVSSNGGPA